MASEGVPDAVVGAASTGSSTSATSAAGTGGTQWAVTVDSAGCFQDQLPPLTSSCFANINVADVSTRGNYRIGARDSLVISVCAGALVNQVRCQMKVESGNGHVTVHSGTADVFGNVAFHWTLGPEDATGPVSFQFFTTSFEGKEISGPINRVIVEPLLLRRRQAATSDDVLPVRAISMQTVISHCLGKIDRWVAALTSGATACHYNMVHLTPVQVRGESGSCYSLADQLSISQSLLPSGMSTSDGWAALTQVVEQLRVEHRLFSTCDVVLNHVASNCLWLASHPDSGYHQENSPWLIAAIELDQRIQDFSRAVSQEHYRSQGLSSYISDESALRTLRRLLQEQVLGPFRIGDWFTIDKRRVLDAWRDAADHAPSHKSFDDKVKALEFECFKTVGVARHTGVCPAGAVCRALFGDNETELKGAVEQVQQRLWRRAGETAGSIVNAIEGTVRYERLECRKGRIGPDHWDALVPRYFTPVRTADGKTFFMANNGWVMNWPAAEDFAGAGTMVYLSRALVAWSDCVKLRYGEKPEDSPFLWNEMELYCKQSAKVFDGIRLDNCHGTPLHVARHLLKAARKENPHLFVYAELFTGSYAADLRFERLLGLHALIRESMQSYSAGQFARQLQGWGGKTIGLLDPRMAVERRTNSPLPLNRRSPPALLFDCTHDNETPSQKRTILDTLPTAALCAMANCAVGSVRGYDELVPKTLSVVGENRLYHDYTGALPLEGATTTKSPSPSPSPVVFRTSLRPYSRSMVVRGSWNNWQESIPLSRRGDLWEGILPDHFTDSMALLQFKFVADGVHWFFDAALPHCDDGAGNTNNVVTLKGAIQQQMAAGVGDCRCWQPGKALPGIMAARAVLNVLHRRLAVEGFTEIDIDTEQEQFVLVERHNPSTHQVCVMVARTAYHQGHVTSQHAPFSRKIPGRLDAILMEAALSVDNSVQFVEEDDAINGVASSLRLATKGNVAGRSPLGFFSAQFDETDNCTTLQIHRMPPGGVFVVISRGVPTLQRTVLSAVDELEQLLPSVMGTQVSQKEELLAYTYLLYSCSNEELDRSKGTRNCYGLPDGKLSYAGIAGVIPYLDVMRAIGSVETTLGQNLIGGDWFVEYQCDRLDTDAEDGLPSGVVLLLVKLASWLRETFQIVVKGSPSRKLRPYYVDTIFSSLYNWVCRRVLAFVPEPLRKSSDPLVKRLCMATLQLYSYVPSAPLVCGTRHPSLAAGLPHFSTGFMRAWGRDTFIALKGCLLDMGRFQETRQEILGFAIVSRHGLIPNLLDSGNKPRFNARDATWFFLMAIVDYCRQAPEGADFLNAEVELKFVQPVEISTIGDLVRYILQQHAQGIVFREWDAGQSLDEHMRDEGFNVNIRLDEATGFLYGGNRWNCGTWMDKMGSSDVAGNRGFPATPRDGAPVEIMGLVKAVLRFINSLPESFGFNVANPSTGYTFKQWESALQRSFEEFYYVPDVGEPASQVLNAALINQRKILRDTVGGSEEWRDYQLRPNLAIAVAVAPELLQPDQATNTLNSFARILLQAKGVSELQAALEKAKRRIKDEDATHFAKLTRTSATPYGLAPTPQLGPKTLDPGDLNYRANYDNSDRSADPAVAHGFNYHNGPEWVWPLGYFLTALFEVERRRGKPELARYHVMRYLLAHREFMAFDPWTSLPEVTDADGRVCHFSCQAQAWSVGSILAALTCVGRADGSKQL